MKRVISAAKTAAAVLLGTFVIFAAGCRSATQSNPSSMAEVSGSLVLSSQTDTSRVESAPVQSGEQESVSQAGIPSDTAPGKAPQIQENSPVSSASASHTQPQISSRGELAATSSKPASSTQPASSAPPKEGITIHIVVECKTAVAYGNKKANDARIAKDGIMCDETLTLKDGATIYDALTAAKSITTGKSLVVVATASGFGKYVNAIQSLAENECGGKSGWLFFVNGVSPGNSSDASVLHDGDRVEWRYTCDYGNDLK